MLCIIYYVPVAWSSCSLTCFAIHLYLCAFCLTALLISLVVRAAAHSYSLSSAEVKLRYYATIYAYSRCLLNVTWNEGAYKDQYRVSLPYYAVSLCECRFSSYPAYGIGDKGQIERYPMLYISGVVVN